MDDCSFTWLTSIGMIMFSFSDLEIFNLLKRKIYGLIRRLFVGGGPLTFLGSVLLTQPIARAFTVPLSLRDIPFPPPTPRVPACKFATYVRLGYDIITVNSMQTHHPIIHVLIYPCTMFYIICMDLDLSTFMASV